MTDDPLDGCWTACEGCRNAHGQDVSPTADCDACVRSVAFAYGRKVAEECAEIARAQASGLGPHGFSKVMSQRIEAAIRARFVKE